MTRGRGSRYLLAVVVIAAAQAVSAQTNDETNAGIQFDFTIPGARSLALGGAFLGLADDATAAYTNPAGLTNLSQLEISCEGRSRELTHVFTDQGRLLGSTTHMGVDQVDGLRTGEAQDAVTSLSFLSLIYPRSHWAVGLYRHELANLEVDFETQGAFVTDNSRLKPTRNALQLDIANLGVSAAYRFKGFSLGLGLSYYDFALHSLTQRFGVQGTYGPPSENAVDFQTQRGADNSFGINLGFYWEVTDDWKIGGAYRQGPKFDFEASAQPVPKSQEKDSVTRPATFSVPDAFGLGAVFQPSDDITIALDYVHIEYSDLTEDLTNIFIGDFSADLDSFVAADSDELHLGIEYIFRKSPVALRFGSWYDPDHKIRYDGEDPSFQALWRRGEDELHFTTGLGYIRSTFQVDTAFDFSDRANTFSLSIVKRFSRGASN